MHKLKYLLRLFLIHCFPPRG